MNDKTKENNSILMDLMKYHKNNIQNLIVSITGARHAQDIEQEVYVKIWKNLSKYREQGNIKSWIKKITVNTCKDHLKSKQQVNDSKTDYDEDALLKEKDRKDTPENIIIHDERKREIMSAVNSLKPKFKEVIILFDMQELSYEEISKKINCPIGTVKSRIFNARKLLQKEFEERRIS